MSVFSDDWRDCLEEHYKAVIRDDDKKTLRTLNTVMDEVGFRDDELKRLEIAATIRAEDMPDGFVPNLEILQDEQQPQIPIAEGMGDFQPHPLECQCPACVEINLQPHDAEGQPIEVEDEVELQARLTEQHAAERKAQEEDDNPQQLSMF